MLARTDSVLVNLWGLRRKWLKILKRAPGLQKRICSKLSLTLFEKSKYQHTLKYRNIMSPHIPESSVKAPRKLRESCCILGKSRKHLVNFSKKSAKFWQILQRFVNKKSAEIQQFLTKKLRLKNGAKECIV